MPKRSHSSSRSSDDKNPLSSARKRSSGSKSTVDQSALRSLWHRKSGAGYQLFISYYGSQPLGVVVPANDDDDDDIVSDNNNMLAGKEDGNERSSSNDTQPSNHHQKGMSRAAKRRRQKQKKSNDICGSNDEQQQQQTKLSNSAAATTPNSDNVQQKQQHKSQQFDPSHPLIQAFNSHSNNNNNDKQQPIYHLTKFIHALSRPLPLTLRLREYAKEEKEQQQSSSSTTSTDVLKQQLSKHYSNLIVPVSYDPTNHIYQSTSNSTLCKSNLKQISPPLKELIVEGSMNGTLARQEIGSMLPVLSLHYCAVGGAMQYGSKVLDLCASPGSKTMQALEIICGSSSSTTSSSSSSSSSSSKKKKMGRIVANDVHPKRLESLKDAIIRSGMMSNDATPSRVIYTNYDASTFPLPKSGKLFDAIICDVPCGGDGTIRKDKHILPMWSPNISLAIHDLQLKILLRALSLVKVGGVVCYSTCSLNPIEDEAVVSAALLAACRDDDNENDSDDALSSFELLDWTTDMLPGFIRRPGVCDWKVAFYDQDGDEIEDKDDDIAKLTFVDNYENALASGMSKDVSVKSTYWPKLSENKRMRLDRCTRLLPQDQDTGGFFLALIKRLK